MSVPVSDSYVESIERIQPHQANNYGNAHGGEVVKLMDELAAMRVAGETCVTASIGSVDFQSPIPVGDVAELSAYVYETGRTSLRVRVDVDSRDPREMESARTTAACFTMVAVDGDGNSVPVPDVAAETDRERDLVERAPC